MNRRGDMALALDIGATKLGVGVVDEGGGMHGWRTVPTLRDRGPDDVRRRLFDAADEVLDRTGASPDAVGIACGGPLDPATGTLLGPLHLPGWDRVPIGPLASERWHVPARLVNDGSAGAWGEYRRGASAGRGSLLYLTVSSGMGGGAVIDGRLLHGATGNGGEFGHVLVQQDGRRCTCGRRGCAEAYAAGTQMAERVGEALRAGRDSTLGALERPTAEDVAARVDADGLAAEIWWDGVRALGSAVTDLVNTLEPDRVVLGGGLLRAADRLLLDPVRQTVRAEAMRTIAPRVRIERSLLGDRACALGVADLALETARAEAVHA